MVGSCSGAGYWGGTLEATGGLGCCSMGLGGGIFYGLGGLGFIFKLID
jgi:hypothetical protein